MNDQGFKVSQYAICTKTLYDPATGEIIYMAGEIVDYSISTMMIDKLNYYSSGSIRKNEFGEYERYRPIEHRDHFHKSQFATPVGSFVQMKNDRWAWKADRLNAEYKLFARKGETVQIIDDLGNWTYKVCTVRTHEPTEYFIIRPDQLY